MSNRSHYTGNNKLVSVPIRGPDTVEYHTDLVVRHTRRLFELDYTIEQALDLVLEAARREFGCRVVVMAPARLRIDGHDCQWPVNNAPRAV